MQRVSSYRGIDPDPGKLRWNLSSGACAINLAVHFGVRRIVLLGYDMQRGADGRPNWHEDYPRAIPKKREVEYDPWPRMLEPFKAIAKDLQRMGIECLNATEGGMLEAFPRMMLEDMLSC